MHFPPPQVPLHTQQIRNKAILAQTTSENQQHFAGKPTTLRQQISHNIPEKRKKCNEKIKLEYTKVCVGVLQFFVCLPFCTEKGDTGGN